MHSALSELIEFLPGLFKFLLAPASIVLVLVGLFPGPRPASALALLAIAMVSTLILSLDLVAIVIVCWSYLTMAFDLLLDLGPAATATVLASLFRGAGARAADFVPMIATTAGASIAAVALRGRRPPGA